MNSREEFYIPYYIVKHLSDIEHLEYLLDFL